MQNYGLQVSFGTGVMYVCGVSSLRIGERFTSFLWFRNFTLEILMKTVLQLCSKYRYEIQKKKREAQKKATGDLLLLPFFIHIEAFGVFLRHVFKNLKANFLWISL